jgi:hypothetical protein
MGAQVMRIKRIFAAVTVLVSLITLGSCHGRMSSTDISFNPSDPSGLVVIGVYAVGIASATSGYDRRVTIAKYDPATRKVVGATDVFGGVVPNTESIQVRDVDRGETFRLYKAAPGDYAVVAVSTKKSGIDSQIQLTRLLNPSTWTVTDATYVFSVKAGEVVYIGDLQPNFNSFPASFSMSFNESGATDYIKTLPNVKAGPTQFRRMATYRERNRRL